MIYPTLRAVALAALGVPVMLAVGLAAPAAWHAGLLWLVILAALLAIDAGLAAQGRRMTVAFEAPARLAVGATAVARARVELPAGLQPRVVELALEAETRLGVSPARQTAANDGGSVTAEWTATPSRRGAGHWERLWLRWRGPLGLAWAQTVQPLDRPAPVTPDVEALKEEAMRLFARDALMGLKAQLDLGGGSEFHALRDFVPGMDRRGVDWKRSARHARLVGKEFRTDRNHQVVAVLDTGRTMSQPLGGVPRIDRAIQAALLLSYVALRIGDRVGLFGFDAKPTLNARATGGSGSFDLLQRAAAGIDYSVQETNYTLGLTSLSAELDRRSLVVLFTDFADATSAELMIENLGRLLRRHVVVFVVFRDEELEAMARAEPREPADVSRAVMAATLLRERQAVLLRLSRLGVHVLDAPAERLGPELINSYLALKREAMG